MPGSGNALATAGGLLGGSVPDHLLVNYRKALVAICLAQFNTRKGFEGGGQVLQPALMLCLYIVHLCLHVLRVLVPTRVLCTWRCMPFPYMYRPCIRVQG